MESISSGVSPIVLDEQLELFISHMISSGRLSEMTADRARRVQRDTADRFAAVILNLGLVSEEDLASELAAFFGLQRIDSGVKIQALTQESPPVTREFLRANGVAPLTFDSTSMRVACWDPFDAYSIEALKFACRANIEVNVAARGQVMRTLDEFLTDSDYATDALVASVDDADEIERLKDLASEAPVIRFVQRLIEEAVRQRASDIHLESGETALHVRFRMDGMLREVEQCGKDIATSVLSRIKVMAGLNIAERRLPQDGRIKATIQGKDIDFRVATSPTLHGESAVLRILDRQDVALDFGTLGFDEPMTEVVRKAIRKPHGIVLVTGPTGSGKTTTLYTALKEINTSDKKILTIEDPVEYVLPGVNQTPLKPQIGLTFANALRSFLRQDPDVMMVGEIRDRETAEIAIQAALTGHLVLSTLHTNSAAGAITRLLDMGIDDYLLTSTLELVIGQRLVRKLCAHCRAPYEPTEEMRARVALTDEVQWYRPVGCDQCHEGFRGRTTILEVLSLNDAVRAKVLAGSDAHQIEAAAVANGMRTLLRHGVERVNAGVTTLEEVLRAANLG